MVVDMATAPDCLPTSPQRVLFSVEEYQGGVGFAAHQYAPARDDQSFWMVTRNTSSAAELILVQNWTEELKERIRN